MEHPLVVRDFRGRERVEPSIDDRYRVVEAARSSGESPFVATLLARFNAGPIDGVSESTSLADFRSRHDPERQRDIAARCAEMAFAPAPGALPAGARRLRTVRVGTGANAPTPAVMNFNDAGAVAVLKLQSLDLGSHVNRLRAKVEAGTLAGRKVTIGYRNNPAWLKVGDNLGPLFALWYDNDGGAATATLTITAAAPGNATRLQVVLADAVPGTVPVDLDLTTAEFDTVAKVVAFINAQAGYTATPDTTDVDLATLPSSQMDAVANQVIHGADAGMAVTIEAKLGAMVEWINTNVTRIGPIPGVVASRAGANSVNAPAAVAAFVTFAGGSQPATVLADYEAALARLEEAELTSGVLFVDTDDATIQAALLEWMGEQDAQGRVWRAAFGMPAATTDAAAKAYAKRVDRTRVVLLHQRLTDIDAPTVERAPYLWAAAVAGMIAGMTPAVDAQSAVLTGKRIRAATIAQLDRRKLPDREALLKAGVVVFREEGGAVVISTAVTTDQGNDPDLGNTRVARLLSESVVVDLIRLSVRDAVRPLNVAWATPQYVQTVKAAVRATLAGWERAGVITAGRDPTTGELRPAFDPPKVRVDNGATFISLSVGMAGEVDHIRIDGTVVKVALESEEN